MDRHFIIARQGKDVFIREVDPASCSYTLSREQVWKRAKELRVLENIKKKTQGSRLFVIGLDGMTTETQWPEEKIVENNLDNQVTACHTTPMPTTTLPTEKQINLFNKLCSEISGQPYTAGFAEGVDRKGASTAIDAAIKLAKERKVESMKDQPQMGAKGTDVPAGRYAVNNDQGTLCFFQVDRPTEGRWAGYTFVKLQASDETYPVRDTAKRERILSAIAEDVQGAMLRYGKEIGKCGHCGRTLTDEQSREDGIGPVCKVNLGW